MQKSKYLVIAFILLSSSLSANGWLPMLFNGGNYSSKRAAKDWGDKMEYMASKARMSCWLAAGSIGKSIRFNSLWFGGDGTYGGVIYRVVDPKHINNDHGYILYASDIDGICRIIIWEDSKDKFNEYCLKTPFWPYAVK